MCFSKMREKTKTEKKAGIQKQETQEGWKVKGIQDDTEGILQDDNSVAGTGGRPACV